MKHSLLRRLSNITLLDLTNTLLYRLIDVLRRPLGGLITYHLQPQRRQITKLISQIRSENEMLLDDIEAVQLSLLVSNTSKIAGHIAEVGSYRGGSSKLICEAKGQRHFHLFDTFNGLPKISASDNSQQFYQGQFAVQFKQVQHYLKKYPHLHFYKGIFPLTAGPIKNTTFSFVHLDLDIYQSTLDALIFFYPRMSPGGVIISHDYINAPGVNQAFNQFFIDKPESIVELPSSQCLVIKR